MNTYSKKIINKLKDFESFRCSSQRISWDEYFFNLSYLVSERSPDAQTKHGAVIVDEERRIISTGYNGFPSGGPDEIFPNIRPKKYPYIVHAEMNALISARCDLKNHHVYITGFPCKSCLLHLVASGIRKIFCGTRKHQEDQESLDVKAVICSLYGVEVYVHSSEDMGKIELFNPENWLLGS